MPEAQLHDGVFLSFTVMNGMFDSQYAGKVCSYLNSSSSRPG